MSSYSDSLVCFSFYVNQKYTDDTLDIGPYSAEKNAFQIRYKQPDVHKAVMTWWCPKSMLETYLTHFFQFIYSDTHDKLEGFQVDCSMMPSAMIRLKKNDAAVMETLRVVHTMLMAFAHHGSPQ